jgi:HEAT repeat protein
MSSLSSFGAALVAAALLVLPGRAQAPAYLGKPLAVWVRDLDSKAPGRRREAVFALGKMAADAGDHLAKLLKMMRQDEEGSVRDAAALAVGEIARANDHLLKRIGVVEDLAKVLAKDARPLVRRSAAIALGQLGDQAGAARSALEKALVDPSPEVRQNAAWALGKIGPEAVPALRGALHDKDYLVLRDAASAVGRFRPEGREAIPELLALCQHPEVEVRKATLGALVDLVTSEDKDALGPLRKALADADLESRRNSALAMGNIGGAEAKAAVPVLVEALLQRGDTKIQTQAAAALLNIGPAAQAALDPLRRALGDSNAELRSTAALALGSLGKEAEPAAADLMRALTNPREDATVRANAGIALLHIGPGAKDKVPVTALTELLADKRNPAEVRTCTLWALRIHGQDLQDYPKLFAVLTKILKEPRTQEGRLLRYDAAFFLGVFQGENVHESVLDALLDFLKDPNVKNYKDTKGKSKGIGEKGPGQATVKQTGNKDGRLNAVQALRSIGRQRVKARSDILKQLRILRQDPQTIPMLRKAIASALQDLD